MLDVSEGAPAPPVMAARRSSSPLAATFRVAQAEADALAAQPPVWRPGAGTWRRGWRMALLPLAAVAALVAGAVFLIQGRAPEVASAAPAAARPTALEEPAAPAQAAPAYPVQAQPVLPAPSSGRADGAGSAKVVRTAVGIAMDLQATPLLEAVERLARATDARVYGKEYLAPGTQPLNLRWHGTSALGAWQALLSTFPNTAVACGAAGCNVWILGAAAGETAKTSPALPGIAPDVTSPPGSPPPVAGAQFAAAPAMPPPGLDSTQAARQNSAPAIPRVPDSEAEGEVPGN